MAHHIINTAVSATVDPAAIVTMTIRIGDRQIGGSALYNPAVIADDNLLARGEIKDFVLGKGSTIRGQHYLCITNVADVSTKTDWTSVTYIFEGITTMPPPPLTFKVPNDKDTVRYETIIALS